MYKDKIIYKDKTAQDESVNSIYIYIYIYSQKKNYIFNIFIKI